jgi:hypothetical protein
MEVVREHKLNRLRKKLGFELSSLAFFSLNILMIFALMMVSAFLIVGLRSNDCKVMLRDLRL